MSFSEWLTAQLADKDIKPVELARMAKIDPDQALHAPAEIGSPDPIDPTQLKHYLHRVTTLLNGKDIPAKKTFLRGLLAYIDIERQADILKGTIYFYLPLTDDINDPPPPTEDYVPSSRSPVGAHLRRHIMAYPFIAPTKRPRS